MIKRLLALSIFLTIIVSSFAQTEKYYAGFIYNFTKNMEWPSNKKSGDFVIAVVGDSPVINYLKQLAATKTVGTQKMVVKQVSSVSAASGAHLIFLSKGKSGDVGAASATAKSSNALLVTEKPGLGKKGAGMNFIDNGGRIGFEINKSQLKACGIKINAKLESLGTVVG